MTIYDILLHASRRNPDTIGVVDGDCRHTYAQMLERVEALAAFLRSRGLGRGDRVSILGPNSGAFLEAYFAAARDGLILNPLNTRLSEDCGRSSRSPRRHRDRPPVLYEIAP